MRMSIRQSIRAAALAALMVSATIIQVHAQAPHTPIPATTTDECSYNSGVENETIGALYYVREVMDDAIIKYEQYRRDKREGIPGAHLESIETHNDYLCDVRASLQGTLEFMTVNILIYVIDYMNPE